MSDNPYFHRGPIDDPAHFYGRQRELTTAFNFLKQRQCLSIVGLRRIGKTSLLLQLQNPQVAESVGLDPDVHKKMCFIYLDTHLLSELNAQEIYQRLAWEVMQQFEYKSPNSIPEGAATSVTGKNPPGFGAFQQSLKLAKEQDCTVLFLFDEFEYLASNPQLSFSFFGQLRSLVAPRNPPVYVTASHRPLEELTYRDNMLGSPFFTIFQPLRLVSLTRKETQTLIRKPAREAGVEFSAETEDFLLELTGGHPFATQIACYYAFDLQQQSALLESENFSEIEEATYEDMIGHLTGYWDDLTVEEQTALIKLVSNESANRTICRNLGKKGLVTRRKGVYQPFSRLFSLFIDEQTPSSSLSESPSISPPVSPAIRQLATLIRARREADDRPYTLLLGSSLSLRPEVRQAVCGSDDWEAFWTAIQRLSAAERRALLAGPLDGLNLAPGYRCLAELVQAGYFNIILTVNIDDTLDNALRILPASECQVLCHGQTLAQEIAAAISRPAPWVKAIKLRGDINAYKLPLALEGQFEFPEALEKAVERLLSQDTILVGDIPYDADVQHCIRQGDGALWVVVPEEPQRGSFLYNATQSRPGKVITGPEAEFVSFFSALARELGVET